MLALEIIRRDVPCNGPPVARALRAGAFLPHALSGSSMTEPDSTPPAGARAGGKGRVERRLAAVLGVDVAGYSALMLRAEEDTHRRVGAELDRVQREIRRAGGRPFGVAGDGVMAEFPSAVEALKCALRIQAAAARRNAKLRADGRIVHRIGINSGEIMLQGGRTGGTAVNVAARLQALAEPGGICLSGAVYDQVRRVITAAYQPMGGQRLKNIRDPVVAYAIPAASCSAWAGMPALPRLALPGAGDYRPSLAVLPFRTLQRDQSDAYFAEGMIDDIIRALGSLQDLLVISRSSVAGFARMPLDVRRVGQELDVQYVLHGSVRRSGDLLRIAVELCAAPTGGVIWADRFDGRLADLFELQDQIALRVATGIAPQLREKELERAVRKHPESMTAYDLTLQALDLSRRMDRASLEQAQVLLMQACILDPGYGHAYSHLAMIYTRMIGQGWSENDREDAERAARARIRRWRSTAPTLWPSRSTGISNPIYSGTTWPPVHRWIAPSQPGQAVPMPGHSAVSRAVTWTMSKPPSCERNRLCAYLRLAQMLSGQNTFCHRHIILPGAMTSRSHGRACRLHKSLQTPPTCAAS
ncbi:MAG: adenylate/guanylate cyclase domain-containing protein [Janthinobacterium lividum]